MGLYSEKFEIVSSGSVAQFKEEPISFKLNDKEGIPAEELILHFTFSSDVKGVSRLEFDRISNSEATYILYNFDNMGTINDKPFEIGEINGKTLYLVFNIIRSHPKIARVMNYTWYLTKEKGTND